MKLHTNKITASDLYTACRGLDGVYVHDYTDRGSRDYTRCLNFYLEGNGRRTNSGTHGAGDYRGATYDEWGTVIARLFEIDPDARFGDKAHPVYLGREHYHYVTADRFNGGELPEDAGIHATHRFEAAEFHTLETLGLRWTTFECRGRKGQPCTARQRSLRGDDWAKLQASVGR